MAITTLDGIVAGAQPPATFLKVGAAMEGAGIPHSFWYTTGMPGAAATPASGLSGAALTSVSGQLPFTNPVSGNSYLTRLSATPTVACTLMVIDRLWDNSGITVTTTTGQTITSAAWPARDNNGSTNGEGVFVALETSAATTNAGNVTNATLTYTNSAGTGSKTATMSSFPLTANAGTFVPFQLAAGDKGVRSIQTLTLGTSLVTGTVHLVAYRVLAVLPLTLANTGNAIDAITGGFPRLYDNTVPQLIVIPSATTALTLTGQMAWSQG